MKSFRMSHNSRVAPGRKFLVQFGKLFIASHKTASSKPCLHWLNMLKYASLSATSKDALLMTAAS